MNIDNVVDYALSKPNNFPGKHNIPTNRTFKQQQPLEPKSQVSLVPAEGQKRGIKLG
jgi:hypothetical protein